VTNVASFPAAPPERDAMSTPWDDERRLLSAIRGGDRAAAEEMVERTYSAVFASLYRLCGDRELAADLCQDTFLSAFRALPRLDPAARLDAWLYTIALNHARGALRRRRLLRWVPFVGAVHDRAVGGDLASRVAAHEQVRELLEQLPVEQRACLLLHADGYRYAEIAHVLGCSVGAVKLRIFRARRHVLELNSSSSQLAAADPGEEDA
jgi:RNA polymerase sigma-70 factor (ECF subfamily)